MLTQFKKYNRNYAIAEINRKMYFYFYHIKMYGEVSGREITYMSEEEMKNIIDSSSTNDS